MNITEVRIKLMEDPDDRLQAFCSITLDNAFVIRDLKIIQGTNGSFVAMPSRKLTAHCPQCNCKNHLRAAYCNQCGLRLKDDLAIKDQEGRTKLYADIAHPINSVCREIIQLRVIEAFQKEREMSQEPGYASKYDEDYDYEVDAAEMDGDAPSVTRRIDRPEARRGKSRADGGRRGGAPYGNEKSKDEAVRPSNEDPEDTFGVGIF